MPGDTVFVKLRAGQYDAVIAMYHDQGHIPVKLLGFEVDPATGKWEDLSGVNITLGLPIIRTSVDHGTAFDIAGKGIANERSLIEAIEYAEAPRRQPRRTCGRCMIRTLTMNSLLDPIEILRPEAIEFGPGTVAAVGALGRAQRTAGAPLVVADAFNAARVDLLGLPGERDGVRRGEARAGHPQPGGGARGWPRRRKPDLVVGFGGGSAMDLAKLVAVLPGSGQTIHEVVGPEKVRRRQRRADPGSDHVRHRQRGRHPRARDRSGDAEQARGAEPPHAGRSRRGRSRPDA